MSAPRAKLPKTLTQAGYQDWRDNLPDSRQGSAVAEKLEATCEYDVGDLEALAPPRGFGRG